ncbi:hypothetical protein [Actinoplanes sp. HUAS TT8]|uniref:hypothetical protein n=1 Tax=Actinoplanes sp. HUAS TT8 TaxID=3447453 RepID=UPI003F5247C9
MVSDVAPATAAVSGGMALRRAAIGAVLAGAACVLVSLMGHEVGDFVDATILLWAVVALYSGPDRHARIAGAAAVVAALVVWLGTVPLPDAGVAGHVIRALLGAAVASQVYALVTQAGAQDR